MISPETMAVLQRSVQTLKTVKVLQHSVTETMAEIGAQTSLQLRSLNIALDIAYRNREVIGQSPVALELINALEQIVLCNYEIIAHITRYANVAQTIVDQLGELEDGGV